MIENGRIRFRSHRNEAFILMIWAGLFYTFEVFLTQGTYWSNLLTRFSLLITIAALTFLLGDLAAWMTKRIHQKWATFFVYFSFALGMLAIIFGFASFVQPVKPSRHELILSALIMIPITGYLFIFFRRRFLTR